MGWSSSSEDVVIVSFGKRERSRFEEDQVGKAKILEEKHRLKERGFIGSAIRCMELTRDEEVTLLDFLYVKPPHPGIRVGTQRRRDRERRKRAIEELVPPDVYDDMKALWHAVRMEWQPGRTYDWEWRRDKLGSSDWKEWSRSIGDTEVSETSITTEVCDSPFMRKAQSEYVPSIVGWARRNPEAFREARRIGTPGAPPLLPGWDRAAESLASKARALGKFRIGDEDDMIFEA